MWPLKDQVEQLAGEGRSDEILQHDMAVAATAFTPLEGWRVSMPPILRNVQQCQHQCCWRTQELFHYSCLLHKAVPYDGHVGVNREGVFFRTIPSPPTNSALLDSTIWAMRCMARVLAGMGGDGFCPISGWDLGFSIIPNYKP